MNKFYVLLIGFLLIMMPYLASANDYDWRAYFSNEDKKEAVRKEAQKGVAQNLDEDHERFHGVISGKSIENDSIKGKDIRDGTITDVDISSNANILSEKINYDNGISMSNISNTWGGLILKNELSDSYGTSLSILSKGGEWDVRTINFAEGSSLEDFETKWSVMVTPDQYLGDVTLQNAFMIFQNTDIEDNFTGKFPLLINNEGNVKINPDDTPMPQDIAPKATLDIEGYMRLKNNSSEPVDCTSENDGSIALTSNYEACVCDGTEWKQLANIGSNCVW